MNTIPDRLRAVATQIDGAQHCAAAAELREVARLLSASVSDLLVHASALDDFFEVPAMERASRIGRMIGAARSAATKIVGFDAAHVRIAS